MTLIKDGRPLVSLTDWERRAGPKAAYQWADGRSAKEAARAWLEHGGTDMPAEVLALLMSHPDFGPVVSWEAEPEAKLRFDSFRGEPRNSDLAVVIEDARGSYLVAVEAKADETFGETIEEAMVAALDRKDKNPRSNGIARIDQLLSALAGPNSDDASKVRALRYQLFTATAGALCEAERRGLKRVVLLVQEFVTAKTADRKHKLNAADFDAFLRRIGVSLPESRAGDFLFGPVQVPGAPLLTQSVALYLGKATRNLRHGA
jgi:hypothetical protein